MDFIDLHSHILPGVDDGAETLDQTLAMLRIAHAGGTRAMVATPHCFLPPWENGDAVVLANSFRQLTGHLAKLAGDGAGGRHGFLAEMKLYLGAENCVSPEFLHALENRQVVTINSSRYVLVEFPPFLAFSTAASAVKRILESGYLPVLAHVERYPFFQKGTGRLTSFIQQGCVAQVNAATFLGASGRGLAKLAQKLLGAGLVHVIASDGHGVEARRPDLRRAAELLSRRWSEERVRVWMWENAVRILANEDLVN